MILKNKQILLLFTLIILCILCIGCVSAADNMNTSNSSDSNICTDNSQVNVDLETSNNLEDANTSIEQSNNPFEADKNENLQINNNEVLTSPASTGIYYVDCTSGSDTNIGSQTSPYKTIGKAVTTINTGSLDEYTVNISPGTYAENHIEIKKNITFTKNPYKSGEVIINGNLGQIFYTTSYTDAYNINFNSLTLTNSNASSGAVIKLNKGNMKITNCKIQDNFADEGAIYIGPGNLTVTESEFLNNFADWGGAAIYHTNGNIIISNSKFINNTGSYGGAIRSQWSNLTVTESEFINNLVNNDSGGAISIGLGNLYCSDTNFINNTAKGKNTYGGAIATAGNITLINTNFINNIANGGGAIFNFEGTLNCINSIFINNKADRIYDDKINNPGLGGAIYLEQESNLYCNNGTKFINNTANGGGAIYALNGCNTTCINTNFINNTAIIYEYKNTTAVDTGGAIKIFNSTLICLNSNFNNNFAGYGSAIGIAAGNGICTNTTFINNTATYSNSVIGLYNSSITCDNLIFNSNKEGVIDGLESNIYINNSKFINNNGTQINSNNGNVYCFFNSFINNTANNYDTSSIISTNNGDLNCNYCVFFNNTAYNNTVITIRNGAGNLDYNWWGSNAPNCNVVNNGELFNLTNTVYMSVLPTIINDKVNSEYTINVILNQYLDSTGNLHNLDKTLPSVLVNLNANGGYLSSTNGYLNENNEFSTKYICPSASGTYSISANIDNETLTIPIKITGGNTPGIYGENLTMTYGTHQNYTGKLIGNDGKPIIGQHVALKLSNSDGQSKTYYATTDTNGEYQLEINLYPGAYTAIASYDTYYCINYIKVLKEAGNLTSTTLTANRFQAPYGTEANFTGKLSDNNGKALIGQHIALKLSNTQGQSKTYYATTDVNGEYQLAINLYPGKYFADCAYTGTSIYDSSTAEAAIIVTS